MTLPALWAREPELELLPSCREPGIGLVPYASLGGGSLTGSIEEPATFGLGDFEPTASRFQKSNLSANLRILGAVRAVASAKGCAPTQLALTWVLSREEDPVLIPGMRRVRYVEGKAKAVEVELSADGLSRFDANVPVSIATGDRYVKAGMKTVHRWRS